MKARSFSLCLVLCALLASSAPARGDDCTFTGGKDGENPIAVDDVAFAGPAGVVIPVLANDIVASGGQLAIHTYSVPGSGQVLIQGPSLKYTPNAGVIGNDFFTYTIRDTTRPNARTSTASVEIRSLATVSITGTCTGGDCIFSATASPADGVSRWEWQFPGEAFKGGWPREFHQFNSDGSYLVKARAIYHTGAVAEGSLMHTVAFKRELRWTCTHQGSAPQWPPPSTTGSNNCTSPMVTIDPGWYRNFDGGHESNLVMIDWGAGGELVEGAATKVVPKCDGYTCETKHTQYMRSGVHEFTIGVYYKDPQTGWPQQNASPRALYRGVVVTTNNPPEPAFRWEVHPYSSRRIYFYPSASKDEIDLKRVGAPGPYEWDFGDGQTQVWPTIYGSVPRADNNYARAGEYVVTLKLTDLEGLSATVSDTVTITNSAPALKITAACRGLQCSFTGNGSTDDYWGTDGPIPYMWNFGNGQVVSAVQQPGSSWTSDMTPGQQTYAQPGCYTCSLTATDGDDATATKLMTVAVSTARLSPIGKVTVDAHSSAYRSVAETGAVSLLQTSGNLNGIVEPGETVVVEPAWSVAASSSSADVPRISGDSFVPVGWKWQKTTARYARNGGYADCWNAAPFANGDSPCHVLNVTTDVRTTPHVDIPLSETHPTGGTVTTQIHVGGSFTDVPKSASYYPFVESLLHSGITQGCGGRNFCPGNTLTRQELAILLLRGKYGAAYTPPACNTSPGPYPDVPCSHWAAAWIAKSKADALMPAYSDGTFRPETVVTRAMMAEPLLRAAYGLTSAPACSSFFTDVSCHDGDMPGGWISELKRRGITSGCTATTYCPAVAIDRGSTAVFLVRAFDIAIDYKVCATGTAIHAAELAADSLKQGSDPQASDPGAYEQILPLTSSPEVR